MSDKRPRRSITLSGSEVAIYDEAMDAYGKMLTGPKLIGMALAEKMDRINHRNDIITTHLVMLTEVAEKEGADDDTLYVIKWLSSTVQKMITGRWSSSDVLEVIRRVERVMKEQVKDHHEELVKGMLRG